MNLAAEFVNWAACDAAFQRAMGMLSSLGDTAVDITMLVADAVQDEAPGVTGYLKSKIDWRIVYLAGTTFESLVISGAFYTKWVLDGRGPVRPMRARALHWIDRGGADVFSMYSRATDPNPFHQRAWRNVRNDVKRRWQKYVNDVARQMNVSA